MWWTKETPVIRSSSPLAVMTRKSSLLLLVLSLYAVDAEPYCYSKQREEWSYGGNNGPQNWWKTYRTCGGMKQSPININTENVIKQTSPEDELRSFGYDIPVHGSLENNGEAVYVRPMDRVRRGFKAYGTTYSLTQLHFHFGSTEGKGTEHAINGRRNSMEMHLVHQSARNTIAVIAILFKESQSSNRYMLPITQKLSSIKYENKSVEIRGLKVDSLFPECVNPSKRLYYSSSPVVYFSYEGSLTTPPCSEGVKWFVMNGATYISHNQMNMFRKLQSVRMNEKPCPLAGNIRPLEDLNKRQVFAYVGRCV